MRIWWWRWTAGAVASSCLALGIAVGVGTEGIFGLQDAGLFLGLLATGVALTLIATSGSVAPAGWPRAWSRSLITVLIVAGAVVLLIGLAGVGRYGESFDYERVSRTTSDPLPPGDPQVEGAVLLVAAAVGLGAWAFGARKAIEQIRRYESPEEASEVGRHGGVQLDDENG